MLYVHAQIKWAFLALMKVGSMVKLHGDTEMGSLP